MEITLKNLAMINFKGIKDKTVFFDNTTNIYGDNATGKTTIFDAFMWLLFGKDSFDRKDFEIKPLNENNTKLHMVEPEVSAILDVDGTEITLKTVLTEKWTKKRGSTEVTFSGNETKYFYNDVPMLMKEYNEKINNLISENKFKLITNPLFFGNLHWTERRKALIELAGDITITDVITAKPSLEPLLKHLRNKTVEEYKKEIAAKKTKIKKELDEKPARIDEVIKNTPATENFEEVAMLIKSKQQELNELETSIFDASKYFEASRQKQEEIFAIESKIRAIENSTLNAHNNVKYTNQNAASKISYEINALEEKRIQIQDEIKSTQNSIDSMITTLETLRQNFRDIDKLVFEIDENDLICPLCKRGFESGEKEQKTIELRNNFEKKKSEDKSKINTQGKNLKAKMETLIEKLNELKSKEEVALSQKENKLRQLDELNNLSIDAPDLNSDPEIINLRSQLAILNQKTDLSPIDVVGLKHKRESISGEIDLLKTIAARKQLIDNAHKRIQELESEMRTLSQKLADLEKEEFLIQEFTETRNEILTSKINGNFKYVKFKFFDELENGGKTECCEATINGVPYSNANNAARINGGLDIINALCKRYNVHAPIFIDNRESINELIETESQVINLIVSNDNDLRIETSNNKEVA